MAAVGCGSKCGRLTVVICAAAHCRATLASVGGDSVAVDGEIGHHIVVGVHGDGDAAARLCGAVNSPVAEGVAFVGIGGEGGRT